MPQPYLHLDIPEPCHENWADMTPTQQGRHCDRCARTLTDFSRMTDRQLIAYFENYDGNLCGRFRQDQLQRPIYQQAPVPRWRNAWLAAMGLGLSSGLVAQTDTIPVPEVTTVAPTPAVTTTATRKILRQFKGSVVDEQGEPLLGATVRLVGLDTADVTDFNGNFTIVLTSEQPTSITIAYTGYRTLVVPVQEWRNATTHRMGAEHLPSVIVSGLTVARVHRAPKRTFWQRLFGRKTLRPLPEPSAPRPTEVSTALQVSPNPIQDHLRIRYSTEVAQRVQLQLIATDGRLLWAQPWLVQPGENEQLIQRTELAAPPALAYLLLITADGQQERQSVIITK